MLKVLLVDDENTVLKGLEYILSRNCPQYEIVGAVQNAAEALHLLEKTKVHVVITDVKMPEMNGVELTNKIRSIYPDTSVVVLSGYSDFEYVRQSMKNGAYDYLLKPCNYQTVLEVLNKIEETISKKNAEAKENAVKKYLEAVLLGKAELPQEWSVNPEMQMMAVSITGSTDLSDSQIKEYIEREFDKLDFDIKKLEVISVDDNIVLVFREPVDLPSLKQKFYHYQQAYSKKGLNLYATVCNFSYNPRCLEQAYNTCRQMMEFLEFNELSMVMDIELYTKNMEQQKKHAVNTYFCGQLLSREILNAQAQKVQQHLSVNLNQFYHIDVYMDPVRIKKEVLEELISMERILKDYGIDIEKVMGKKIDYLHELKRLKTLQTMLNWLRNFTMAIAMSIQQGNDIPYYIHTAVKYIETHYMEDLSLKTVADEVYLNPWYLSSQLKKFTGLAFSEYLNQVRVRVAKELLKQKDLKVYQVAEMTGFQDAAYFNTVFKGIENITPKEYQKIVLGAER